MCLSVFVFDWQQRQSYSVVLQHLYDVVALAAATIAAAIVGPTLALRWCLGRHRGKQLPVVARGLSRSKKRE